MKFNKTITFDASPNQTKSHHSGAIKSSSNGSRQHQQQRQAAHQILREHLKSQPPLDEKSVLKLAGQAGLFSPIKNDFSNRDEHEEDEDDLAARIGTFQENPEWSVNERADVKRVRFVVCVLALLGLAFALMSRLILNVSIVEMVKGRQIIVIHDELLPEHLQPLVDNNGDGNSIFDSNSTIELPTVRPPLDELLDEPTTAMPSSDQSQHQQDNSLDDGLHFDWSKRQVNMILGSFYLGYMPGILFSGGIAQRYGAKYPLLLCVFGTSIINMLTPTIARSSLRLLIFSRVCLGLIQGSLFPALYELFNRWLTQTESSIFAPMIKVSMPLGSVIGTLMPGILASFGLEWPYLFYLGGGLCLVWSSIWLYVATSSPQTNKYVSETELKRIMRKKILSQQQQQVQQQVVSITINSNMNHKTSPHLAANQAVIQATIRASNSTPWRLIVLNPSVLALTIVKYTYNIGMDFIYLELAVYLREAHSASIETISMIASCGYCMQMFLITFVGWLAKTVVTKRAFNLSVTKWRKAFQGGSNFSMAFIYIVLALTNPGLELASLLMILVCFFWMLGAGGESMVPYDLSSKYPASIVGFAHSVSILSGVSVPIVFDLVLGEETNDPERWRLLFLLVAGALTVGGLVFVSVLKAKPFLPGERVPKNRTPVSNVDQRCKNSANK